MAALGRMASAGARNRFGLFDCCLQSFRSGGPYHCFPRLPGFRVTATLCNCAEFHERLKREYYILTRRQSTWGGSIFGSYLAAIATMKISPHCPEVRGKILWRKI